jgi:hypothetical protein
MYSRISCPTLARPLGGRALPPYGGRICKPRPADVDSLLPLKNIIDQHKFWVL